MIGRGGEKDISCVLTFLKRLVEFLEDSKEGSIYLFLVGLRAGLEGWLLKKKKKKKKKKSWLGQKTGVLFLPFFPSHFPLFHVSLFFFSFSLTLLIFFFGAWPRWSVKTSASLQVAIIYFLDILKGKKKKRLHFSPQ